MTDPIDHDADTDTEIVNSGQAGTDAFIADQRGPSGHDAFDNDGDTDVFETNWRNHPGDDPVLADTTLNSDLKSGTDYAIAITHSDTDGDGDTDKVGRSGELKFNPYVNNGNGDAARDPEVRLKLIQSSFVSSDVAPI